MMSSGPYFFQSGGGSGAAGSGMTGLAFATFTPTGSWTLNCTYTGGYSRIGEYMRMNVKIAFAGAPNGTANMTINLPAGFSMDTGKIMQASTAVRTPLPGCNAILDAAVLYPLVVTENDPTSIFLASNIIPAAGASFVTRGALSATLPATIANGNTIVVWAEFPIVGWRP